MINHCCVYTYRYCRALNLTWIWPQWDLMHVDLMDSQTSAYWGMYPHDFLHCTVGCCCLGASD